MKKNIGMNNESNEFQSTLRELTNKDEKTKMLVAMLRESTEQFGAGSDNPMYDFLNQKIEDVVSAYIKRRTAINEREMIFEEIMPVLHDNYTGVTRIGVTTAEIVTDNGIFVVKVSTTNMTHKEKQEELKKRKEEYGGKTAVKAW